MSRRPANRETTEERRAEMGLISDRLERFQIPLYLFAVVIGAVAGLAAPSAGHALGYATNPALGVLLYLTFLQVPVASLLTALRDGRFLAAIVAVNFVAVPLLVGAVFWALPSDQAIRVGVLMVLLCPCVDYVIVFSGLAGADHRRLLAATPLLLILQMLTLPVFLTVFLGSTVSDAVAAGPFLRSFLVLIVIPLLLAAVTQAWAARRRAGVRFTRVVGTGMVPAMMVVLAVVVAAQLPVVGDRWPSVLAVVPLFVAFLVVMPFVGAVVGTRLRLDVGARRAVAFSGATRNSLVVMPLALALPAELALAPAVIVTQTLVEILGMTVYVRLIPKTIA